MANQRVNVSYFSVPDIRACIITDNYFIFLNFLQLMKGMSVSLNYLTHLLADCSLLLCACLVC